MTLDISAHASEAARRRRSGACSSDDRLL